MNPEQLNVRIRLATAGWLAAAGRQGGTRPAFQAHMDLLAVLNASSSQARRTTKSDLALYRALLRTINGQIAASVRTAKEALLGLRDAQCRFYFEEEQPDGVAKVALEYGQMPMLTGMEGRLSLGLMLHELPQPEQIAVSKWASARVTARQHQMLADDSHRDNYSPEQTTRLRVDAAARASLVKSLASKLSPRAQAWVERHHGDVGLGWGQDVWPIQVALTAARDDILFVASAVGEVGKDMYRPLDVHPRANAGHRSRWNALLGVYEDCGEILVLASVWLKNLAEEGGARRCNVCYRHLPEGESAKRFCTCHRRTARQRQSSRDLHVSSVYRDVLRSFLPSCPDPDQCLREQLANPAALAFMEKKARRFGVDEDLVRPAAVLALTLRGLWPFSTSALAERLERHFGNFLRASQVPFKEVHPPNTFAFHQNEQVRKLMPLALGWEEFFRTWFAEVASPSASFPVALAASIDPDHPLARLEIVSPVKIAFDLAHVRCWYTVDDAFDGTAYMSSALEQELGPRQADAGYALHVTKIAERLGVSRKAVYDQLKRDKQKGVGGSRKRALLHALHRLRVALGARPS
jgi:hypothetical protein